MFQQLTQNPVSYKNARSPDRISSSSSELKATSWQSDTHFGLLGYEKDSMTMSPISRHSEHIQMFPADDNKHDLTAEGLSGNPELEKVFDAEAEIAVPDHGEHVAKIQRALIALGFELPLYQDDGYYGEETKKAIIDFQKKAGMSEDEWDGIVGRKTLGLLDKSLRNGEVQTDIDDASTDWTVFKPNPDDNACENQPKQKNL